MNTPAAIIARSYGVLKRGDPRGAEVILGSLWNAGPAPPADAVHLLGLIRRAQGRLNEAEQLLRQSIEQAPHKGEYQNNLGLLLLAAGFPREAIACFQEAVRLQPDLAPAHLNLARAFLAVDDAQAAESAARAALALAPNGDHHTVLGAALRGQGRIDEALQEYAAALQIDPMHAGARHDQAIAFHQAGRSEEALHAWRELHAGGLRANSLFLNWAGVLLDQGDMKEAESVLLAGLAAHSQDYHLHMALAKLNWLLGDSVTYTRAFEGALARKPQDLQMRLGCADFLRRGGHFARAEVLVREGLAQVPDHPALLGALGVLRGEQYDTSQALLLLERAAAAAPHEWSLRESLVDAQLQAGKAKEALAHIDLARNARPHDQAWIAHEGSAYRQLGDARAGPLYDYERLVRSYDLAPPSGFATIEALNAALAAHLRSLHLLKSHPIDQSLIGGTQTSRSLLLSKDPLILAFLRALEAPIADYVAAMPDESGHPMFARKNNPRKLVGCWSVKLAAGGFHVNHVHPEGWISSAYYVSVPDCARGASDRQGWIQFGAPRHPTPGCEAQHFVEPRAGRLVLFPSYMWHGTIPFHKGIERLTIAFDVAASH